MGLIRDAGTPKTSIFSRSQYFRDFHNQLLFFFLIQKQEVEGSSGDCSKLLSKKNTAEEQVIEATPR